MPEGILPVGFAKVAFTSSGLGMRGRPGRPPGFTVHDDLFARAMVVESPTGVFAVLAADHMVNTSEQLATAIKEAKPGDRIVLAPGNYVLSAQVTVAPLTMEGGRQEPSRPFPPRRAKTGLSSTSRTWRAW
jgi:hypothetical protein